MEMTKKKHLVVLSGAGMSADSGVSTFRDSDGLWEKHRIEDICTPQALKRNPKLVLEFYNARRRQLGHVEPNAGHRAVAELESYFDVSVITQNVDNLHERAGSSRIVHLHGELTKCRSVCDDSKIFDIQGDIQLGDTAPDGGQLRPHIVFFGEAVPEFDRAVEIMMRADVVVIVGTSLVVYPAASLVNYVARNVPIYVVDPSTVSISRSGVTYIRQRAAIGMPMLVEELIGNYANR